MKVQQNMDVKSNLYPAQGSEQIMPDPDKVKAADNGSGNLSVSGADLKIQSILEQRQGIARKHAYKIVADAFEGEKKLDAQMQSIKDRIHSLADEINEMKNEYKSSKAELKNLMVEYGVEPYSREYMELQQYAKRTRSSDPEKSLSVEEYDNLTEFQKKALYYVVNVQDNDDEIKRKEGELAATVTGYADFKRERLKSHDMIDAQKEAENIMDASTEEAIALLTSDAVENIDEEQKEREEEAKEAEEKKKEEKKKEAKKLEKEAQWQELIEDIRDKVDLGEVSSSDAKRAAARRERAEAEESDPENYNKVVINEERTLEDMQEGVNTEITNILNKLALLSNDLKGTTIDDQI